ncbi:FAD/NAD(P)-binding protein [Tropicimonas sp. IMCC6043]|uniref:FAD/NAD(P)-binding protein n=1 Tax=Tropicimonas sp. IMCC6043 TaxID=2510645 RepID=UPI001F5DF75D|nr:FAD/NAD(P)-binding protein [Tropicimonas sp. IMCC6043]
MLAPNPQADPMVPVLARITRRIEEVPDVVTFEMEAPDWNGFAPGQFNMLGVFGVGEIPISISGPASEPDRLVHTIRAVGPVSRALAGLAEGAALGLRGPFGNEWPVETARGRDVVVIAGGLGLAPVRPVLYHLLENRNDFNKVILLYGARRPEEMLFTGELSAWRARFDIEVAVTVDHAAIGWHGHVGVVTSLLRNVGFDPASTSAFVCGPEIMMRFAARALVDAGVAPGEIWMSMERNMHCAIGLCGHCQLGPVFICRDGPIFDWARLKPLMMQEEL